MQGSNPTINTDDIPEFYAEFETDTNGFNKVWINPTEVVGFHPVPGQANKTLIDLVNGRSYNVLYDAKLVSQLLARCWMNALSFEGTSNIGTGVLAGAQEAPAKTPTRR